MEQAPQHFWRSAPEWPPPAPPLWWTRGGKMAWRWEPWTVEGRRGMECGNQTAEPPLPKDSHLCPSRPANGGTDSRRMGSGKGMAPTSGNPKVWKKEPTPYHPGSAYGHQNVTRRRSAYRAACQNERNPKQRDPLVERRRKSDLYPSPATWTQPGLMKSRRIAVPEPQ